jgi:cytochrome c oxidase cbb3-type subunit 1
MHPFYVIRMIGGLMYVSGMIIMLWNVIKTVQMGQAARIKIPSTVVHA